MELIIQHFISIFVLGFCIKSIHSAATREPPCKSEWERINKNCYLFSLTLSTWNEANNVCTKEGARLLSIGSPEERSSVVAKITRKVKRPEHMTWWVGLVLKNFMNREWVWLDQSPLNENITRFAKGEPNNKSKKENCIELHMTGTLNDDECTRRNPFICEITREREHKPSTLASTSNHKTQTKIFTLTTRNAGQPNIVSTSNPLYNPLVVGADKVGDRERKDKQEYIPNNDRLLPVYKHENDINDQIAGASKDDKRDRKSTTENPNRSTFQPGRVTLKHKTKKPKKDSDDDETNSDEDKVTKKPGGKDKTDKTKKPWRSTTEGPRENKNELSSPSVSENSPTTASTYIDIVDFELHEDCFGDESLYEDESKKDRVNKKSTKKQLSFCPKVEFGDITFPKTRYGSSVTRPCGQGGASKAYWSCNEEHKCWFGEPNTNECVSKELQGILDKVDGELNEEKVLNVTGELANIVNEQEQMTAEDIMFTTKMMKSLVKAASRVSTDKTAVKNVVRNIAQIGNGILKNKEKPTSGEPMSTVAKNQAATSLLKSMESSATSMVEALNEPAVIKIEEDNLVIEMQVLDVNDLPDDGVVIGKNEKNSVQIPKETLKSNSEGGLAKTVVMVFNEISHLLEPDNSKNNSENKQFVSSKVVSANLGEQTVTNLSDPVILTFAHTQEILPDSDMKCSFLDMSTNRGIGKWSQSGCVLLKTDDEQTTCSCNHLTNFAVLMDVHGVKLSEEHQLALEYITYIGCTISIICLVASWFTFMCLTSLQGERNSIHKNLVFCLLIAEVLFLAGINRTDSRVGCAVIAGFLHYLFLAVFMWMYLEGLHIIFMIVQVFDSSKSRLPFYYAAGYGIPAVVVGISAIVYSDGYGTASHCWLSTERYFIWSFAGPVAIILLVNMVVLIYAMTMVCKQSDYVFASKTSSGRMRSWIQGAIAMEVLLGLTWIFGYLFISGETLVFAYIFSILNSLQGLFIFVYHCILSKKVRNEYMKILEASSISTRSTSGNTKTNTATKKQSIPNGSLDASHVDTPL